jgi:hypothetical protein
MVAMNPLKPALFLLFLIASLLAAVQASAKTILPDACGNEKIQFDVQTLKNQPPPGPPAAGKAQIIVIETLDKSWMCLGCGTPSMRVGMDGVWIGATQGASYFSLDILPGEHDLCVGWQSAFGHLKKMVGLTSFTAKAGEVYYFEAKAKIHEHNYGNNSTEIDRDLDFVQVDELEGGYGVKAGKLAISKPNK